MRRTDWPRRLVLGVGVVIGFALAGPSLGAGEPEPIDVSSHFATVCKNHKVPGLVGAGIRDGKLWAVGAAGYRQSGKSARVTLDDRFHIGSCTKSMTATLAAVLVEQGVIEWETTIEEALPEQAKIGRESYRRATLEQLLEHKSGLPKDSEREPAMWNMIRGIKGPMVERRGKVVKIALRQEPVGAPGELTAYSHLGYTVAGAMLEAAAGKPYEDLMREHLFEPLGMTSAGFGPPGVAGKLEEPVGHSTGFGGRLRPMPPSDLADFPAVIAPAGTVHCTIEDWAKFAILHLRGARGEETVILSPESFERMYDLDQRHEDGLGWGISAKAWGGGRVLTHSGSNDLWFASVWIAPKGNCAYLAACNRGDKAARLAVNDAQGVMIFNNFDGEEPEADGTVAEQPGD